MVFLQIKTAYFPYKRHILKPLRKKGLNFSYMYATYSHSVSPILCLHTLQIKMYNVGAFCKKKKMHIIMKLNRIRTNIIIFCHCEKTAKVDKKYYLNKICQIVNSNIVNMQIILVLHTI